MKFRNANINQIKKRLKCKTAQLLCISSKNKYIYLKTNKLKLKYLNIFYKLVK